MGGAPLIPHCSLWILTGGRWLGLPPGGLCLAAHGVTAQLALSLRRGRLSHCQLQEHGHRRWPGRS